MLAACIPLQAGAQASASAETSPDSLLDYWLALPHVAEVAWPFAYIRSSDTRSIARSRRQDLVEELDRLLWRLEAAGRQTSAKTVKQWQASLSRLEHFRLPGTWSPAWLLANPNQNPPFDRIVALGICQPPEDVELWDRHGITRLQWTSGLDLAKFLERRGGLNDHGISEVNVVTPTGEILRRGIAPWNFANVELPPGTRIVAALPLQGEAFVWIRDSIAGVLAHTPSGNDCREISLRKGGNGS